MSNVLQFEEKARRLGVRVRPDYRQTHTYQDTIVWYDKEGNQFSQLATIRVFEAQPTPYLDGDR